MRLFSNLKGSAYQERQINKNISFKYILDNNVSCIQFIKEWFDTQINEIQRIVVFLEGSLQVIDFKIKCLEITTYPKTPMK